MPKTFTSLEVSSVKTLGDKQFEITAPLIDNFLPGRGLYLFCGSAKVGKSWLALQIALCVSSGMKFWCSPNLYFKRIDEICIVGIEMDDICRKLSDYLNFKSLPTKENYFDDNSSGTRLISLSALRAKLVLEMSDISEAEKEKKGLIPYVQYQLCDQLNMLVRRIDMIVELGRMQDEEIFLSFRLE
ncbi:MAG: AAA family ATPase [Aeriscardovia sp.]|nr:AAA family ATPase [Aeriscardovia sp.]